MKRLSIILCSILVFSILTGFSNTVSADYLPTINSAVILQTTATNGQQIEININATDGDGISFLYFYLYAPEQIAGNGPTYIGGTSTTYNASIGMYQGFYTISQYDPINITIGDIYIEDGIGNYYDYYNSYLFSSTYSFTSGFTYVTGTTPDYTPPVLNYISVNASILNAGNVLNITASATDSLSGVNYIHVSIYQSSPGTYYYNNQFVADVYLYVNSLGNYSGLWRTYSYTENGTYTIGTIDLYDNQGNGISYYNDPYAVNSFSFNDFLVINQNYQIPISNVYFDYLTVDNLASQTMNFKINNFGSGFNYGYFYFEITDPYSGGNYYYGYLYVTSSDYNTTTGYYEKSLSSFYLDGTSITNGSINLSYFYMYQMNGDTYTVYDYSSNVTAFRITGQLNQPFEVSIAPNFGSNYLGQNTTLGVKVISNDYLGGSGNVSLSITGTESYNGTATQLNFSSYGELLVNQQIHFNATGPYVITAKFVTTNGIYTYSSTWDVKEPPFPEFQVSINPSSGSSEVNQQVSFNLNVTSTFLVNKTGIQVYILGAGPQIVDQSFTIDVNALSSLIVNFNITFSVAGSYDLNATLTDGNGYWWSTTYTWNVGVSSNTTTSTSTSSSSATDTVSSDQTTGNNTAIPQISLPGFGFYITIIGFSFMVATTYRSRKL